MIATRGILKKIARATGGEPFLPSAMSEIMPICKRIAEDIRNQSRLATYVVHVGHSTGGGEVVRYIGRHGSKKVAKIVVIGAVPPLMLKTATNPGGLPIEVFNQIREGVLRNRSQLFKDLSLPFYGYNRSGVKVSEGVRDFFWLQGMMVGMPPSCSCIKAFSETDLTGNLRKVDVPTLFIHGDDDQIVPIGDSAILASKIVKDSKFVVYIGGSHGVCTVEKDRVNADLLAFIQESRNAVSGAR